MRVFHSLALSALLTMNSAALQAQDSLFVGSTEEILQQAISQYSQRNPRGAIANLRNVISPAYRNSVRTEQKVRAFLYLGAAFADVSATDSSHKYFIAALYFDSLANVSSSSFRESARTAFAAAKARLAKLPGRKTPPP